MLPNVVNIKDRSLFDRVIESEKIRDCIGATSMVELLYNNFAHRSGENIILIGHLDGVYTEVSLAKLRSVVFDLIQEFKKKGLKHGDDLLLGSFEINNELYTAILFIALSVLGVNTILPMYMDRQSLYDWHKLIPFKWVILPISELSGIQNSSRQKVNALSIYDDLKQLNIEIWDTLEDFDLSGLLKEEQNINSEERYRTLNNLKSNDSNQIILSTTTSGTTGCSKIVQYDANSLLRNISSWKQAGLLDPEILGGASFTPLFTHTMGIRTFLNAVYCGKPTIIIPISWFSQKPEVAKYFIEKGKPKHVTGGPGVFRTLLEMGRAFPRLKDSLRKSLEVVISSGAGIDVELMKEVEEAFCVRSYNAFGSSENQQVINTILAPKTVSPSLFGLLPGVKIGLFRSPLNPELFRLYILSSFGCSHILNAERQDVKNKYLYLGDLVALGPDGIEYKEREQSDYIKDSFGVKIPLNKVLNYYKLDNGIDYIKLLPLGYQPGLAALIFISGNKETPHSDNPEDRIKKYIASRNLDLFQELPPLDFNHRVIRRFALIDSKDFRNRKGLVSERLIQERCSDLLEHLVDEHYPSEVIIDIPGHEDVENSFERFHNPYLGKLMKVLQLDRTYLSGYGDYLYTSEHLSGEKYLDLTGGYGTNLLGHSNQEIWERAKRFLSECTIPISDQFSIRKPSGELAQKLNQILHRETGRDFVVLFGSTGTEAVEMAIHHAYLEWKKTFKLLRTRQYKKYSGTHDNLLAEVWSENQQSISNSKPCIITNTGSYHGNLSNARALNSEEGSLDDFMQLSAIKRLVIDDELVDLEYELSKLLDENCVKLKVLKYRDREVSVEEQSFSTIMGSILEPIKGEGGIKVVNPKLPRLLSDLPFPLIFDEIQSGLGRSGNFLASKPVIGDYYVFAKALGGNLSKISALAIDRNRFDEKFGKKVVSTFSGGGYEASIALETLKIIERDNVPAIANKIGGRLKSALDKIITAYRDSFEPVEGKGLMLGLRLRVNEESGLLHIFHQKKVLGYLVASYFLNRFKIRIMPSLSAPSTLRIEPSINLDRKSMDSFLTALHALGEILQSQNIYELCKHLIDDDLYDDLDHYGSRYGLISTTDCEPEQNAQKVAFVGHFVNPAEELGMLDSSLWKSSQTGLLRLFYKLQHLMEGDPFILNSQNLFNDRLHLSSIIIPLSTASMEKLHRTGKRTEVIDKIQKAVDMAARRGAKVISLGGYNSIITDNGLKITPPEGVHVVTGNTLTAVVGYQSFMHMVWNHLEPNAPLTIGIVGATGNIGRMFSQNIVSEQWHPESEFILFGRNTTLLQKLKNEIEPIANVEVRIGESLSEIKECDAVFVSVNTNDPLLYVNHFANNKKVVVFDVSIPHGVSDQIIGAANIIYQKHGASIILPEDPDLLITSCSPPGTALCCVSEALLGGLEGIQSPLRGKITIDGFKEVKEKASRYGLLKEFEEQRSFVGY